jgi:hypothetical protein
MGANLRKWGVSWDGFLKGTPLISSMRMENRIEGHSRLD